MLLEVESDEGLHGGALRHIEVVAVSQIVSHGLCRIARAGAQGTYELVLLDHVVLQGERSDEEVTRWDARRW
jgi:hypothetical protein